MTAQDIARKVNELQLPAGSYIVFGGCPMAVAGIREAHDIDLLISKVAWQQLRESGWQEIDKEGEDKPLVHDVFDTHTNWHIGSYDPSLEQLLGTATFVDGVPFAALEEVKNWKVALGRPKDVKDIELIDAYLSGQRN
ncbi:MAG: hypothetical protein JWR85_3859 [Marmoricola sp.]|nr:hypothetical protein [Marmoricola sp.]